MAASCGKSQRRDGSGMNERLTYTVEETAELLGCGRAAAYQAVKTGDIPSVRLGRRILVPRARLMALLGERSDLSLNGNGSAATEPVADTTPANGAPGHDEG
jgi:excisionase family DNA binding protein